MLCLVEKRMAYIWVTCCRSIIGLISVFLLISQVYSAQAAQTTTNSTNAQPRAVIVPNYGRATIRTNPPRTNPPRTNPTQTYPPRNPQRGNSGSNKRKRPIINWGNLGRLKLPKAKPKPNKKIKKPRKPKKVKTKKRSPRVVRLADRRFRKKEVIVVLARSRAPGVERAVARQYNLRLLKGYDVPFLNVRVQSYRIPDRRTVEQVLSRLRRDKRFLSSQPNYVYNPVTQISVSKVDENLQYAHLSLRTKHAHAYAVGRGIKIAIVDTGIDINHPAFKKSIVNTFNAVDLKKSDTGHKHGTAVAGIIAARDGLVGVAPMAKLLDARAFIIKKGKRPETTTMILINALKWSHEQNAKIINLSFAGPKDPLFKDALQALYKKGHILVAAAGNSGPKARPAYPAAYRYVIAATAIDSNNKSYKHANRGRYVTVAAPGVDIMVLTPSQGFHFSSGTSLAAAHISGLIALMLERNPDLTADQVRKLITDTALDLGKPGRDDIFGAGSADAYSSLSKLLEVSLSKN